MSSNPSRVELGVRSTSVPSPRFYLNQKFLDLQFTIHTKVLRSIKQHCNNLYLQVPHASHYYWQETTNSVLNIYFNYQSVVSINTAFDVMTLYHIHMVLVLTRSICTLQTLLYYSMGTLCSLTKLHDSILLRYITHTQGQVLPIPVQVLVFLLVFIHI